MLRAAGQMTCRFYVEEKGGLLYDSLFGGI